MGDKNIGNSYPKISVFKIHSMENRDYNVTESCGIP